MKTEEGELALILDNINIKVGKGKLIGLIGKIGSGKSTLINGLIGEVITLEEDNVEINISGTMSYVSQKSWIQNETIKNNILFGKPYDEKLYREAIFYSAMETDLEIMADGDLTQIGEKGANLSGG